jgi:hypothetical protein
MGSIGPFLSLDDIPFIVYADNLGLIRYGIFFGVSIIETGKWSGILDPRRPNRLSVGLRHIGINNQVFHLNPPLSYDSSEKPPLLRFEGGSAKSDFAQFGYGSQLLRLGARRLVFSPRIDQDDISIALELGAFKMRSTFLSSFADLYTITLIDLCASLAFP